MTEVEAVDEREQLISELEQELKSKPSDVDLQRRLGWAYYGRGRFQDARKVLDEAASIAKQDIEVLYALGMASKMSGEKRAARETFEALREIPLGSEQDARRAMLKRMADLQLLLMERQQ
jgi:cytochrome c-type biogenesis protein CcmH/NrfG